MVKEEGTEAIISMISPRSKRTRSVPGVISAPAAFMRCARLGQDDVHADLFQDRQRRLMDRLERVF